MKQVKTMGSAGDLIMDPMMFLVFDLVDDIEELVWVDVFQGTRIQTKTRSSSRVIQNLQNELTTHR